MMNDKRGQLGSLVELSVGGIAVLSLLLVVVLGILGFFTVKFLLPIVGVAILVLSVTSILPAILKSKAGLNRQTLGVLLIFLFLGVGFIVVPRLDLVQQEALGGFTAFSIDRVDIVGEGERIRVTGTLQGAEALNVIRADDLNGVLEPAGFKATRDTTMKITLDSQSITFPTDLREDQQFYTMRTVNIGIELFGVSKECIEKTPSGTSWTGQSIRDKYTRVVCIYNRPVGNNAPFTAREIIDSSVTFDVGGSRTTLNPGRDVRSTTLSDGTRVQWAGDLIGVDNIGTPFQFSSRHLGGKSVGLIRSNSYALFKDSVQDAGVCMGNADLFTLIDQGLSSLWTVNSVDDISDCVVAHNNRVGGLLSNRISDYNRVSGSSQTAFFTNEGLKLPFDIPQRFPVFTLDIDADKVGIIRLSGKPRIVSCVDFGTLNTGSVGSDVLVVANDGSQEGSFFASLSCSGEASVSGTIGERFVGAGETANFPVTVYPQSVEVGVSRSSCGVTVTDRNSGNADSCSFVVDVNRPVVAPSCEPNSVLCLDASALQVCDAQGLPVAPLTVCEGVCVNVEQEDGSVVGGCVAESAEDVAKKPVCGEGETLKVTEVDKLIGTDIVYECVKLRGVGVPLWVWLALAGLVPLGLIVYLVAVPPKKKRAVRRKKKRRKVR